MSALVAPAATPLGTEVIEHLDAQLHSGRRLLELILRQGAAIREHEVDAVLARLADVRTEMELRAGLEGERERLLTKAGGMLGIPAQAVTLEGMTRLMGPAQAEDARARSAELRGLLAEIAREHGINRALMRQELAFLDHLVRLVGGEPDAGYKPGETGVASPTERPASPHRVLDLQA